MFLYLQTASLQYNVEYEEISIQKHEEMLYSTEHMYFSPQTIERLRSIQGMLDALKPEAEPQTVVLSGAAQPDVHVLVFAGSFNPPTNAHLALLQQARAFLPHHTTLYAAVSKRIIDKETVEYPTLLDRLDLLTHVLRVHIPDVGILLFNRGLYVEQAQALRAAFPQVARIFFLVGFDKIVQVFDPRYYTDRNASLRSLFHIAEMLVAPRGDAGEQELAALLRRPENAPFAHAVHALPLDAQYRHMSSTQIRLGERGNITGSVPPEVQQFMAQTRVYEQFTGGANGSEYYAERVRAIERLLTEG